MRSCVLGLSVVAAFSTDAYAQSDGDFAISCQVQHAKNRYPPFREFGDADLVQFNIYPGRRAYWRVGEYNESNEPNIVALEEMSPSKLVLQYKIKEFSDGERRAIEETIDRNTGTYLYVHEKGCWNGRESRSDWCRIVYKAGRCEKADQLFSSDRPAAKF